MILMHVYAREALRQGDAQSKTVYLRTDRVNVPMYFFAWYLVFFR